VSTYRIYIDRQTGTWGSAQDLVIKEIPEEEVNALEELGDSSIREIAYKWEQGNA
jgi:hypothetical protein